MRRLRPALASLSPEQAAAVVAGVVAAAGGADARPERRADRAALADIERLMAGFQEEVQKLDETLRVLAAYVTGLRRSSRDDAETLH
jgi:hypothetical protein